MEYAAWARGTLPDYRPSRGDLYLFAKGIGAAEPVAVVGVPTK